MLAATILLSAYNIKMVWSDIRTKFFQDRQNSGPDLDQDISPDLDPNPLIL